MLQVLKGSTKSEMKQAIKYEDNNRVKKGVGETLRMML